MKKFTKTKATGRRGVAFVEGVISEAGSIFREVPEETDVGIDGYIEFVEGEVVTGTLVAVQIKTGQSYTKQRKGRSFFEVTFSRNDINYLHIHQLPTAIIFYEPEGNYSGWLDITGYLRNNPTLLEQANIKIALACDEQPFNTQTFQNEFKRVFRDYRIEVDRSYFVELMVSHDQDKKYLGFIGLMSQPRHRFSEVTCFLLISHLFDQHDEIRFSVTDVLSRYLSHPEVGFVPPKHIREYVELAISQMKADSVVELLKTALLDEENLMQRGSIGQSAGVIIAAVPSHEQILYDIAVDQKQDTKTRVAAMALAHEFMLTGTIMQIARNLDKFAGSEVSEEAGWVAELALEMYSESDNENRDFLNEADENMINEDGFALLIRESNAAYLVDNERTLYRIMFDTKNPYVRFEVSRALDKVAKIKQNNNAG